MLLERNTLKFGKLFKKILCLFQTLILRLPKLSQNMKQTTEINHFASAD